MILKLLIGENISILYTFFVEFLYCIYYFICNLRKGAITEKIYNVACDVWYLVYHKAYKYKMCATLPNKNENFLWPSSVQHEIRHSKYLMCLIIMIIHRHIHRRMQVNMYTKTCVQTTLINKIIIIIFSVYFLH